MFDDGTNKVVIPLTNGCKSTLQKIRTFFRDTFLWRECPTIVKKQIEVTLFVPFNYEELKEYTAASLPRSKTSSNENSDSNRDKAPSWMSLQSMANQAANKINVRNATFHYYCFYFMRVTLSVSPLQLLACTFNCNGSS